MIDPEALASAVAVALHAGDPPLRSIVDRVEPSWSLEDPEGHYVIVRPVTLAPGLRGDGRRISDAQLVQVDLYQLRGAEVPARAAAIVALDGAKLPGLAYRVRLQSMDRVEDPADPTAIRHLATLRIPTTA